MIPPRTEAVSSARGHSAAAFALVLVCVCSQTAWGQDWPGFRGPTGLGYTSSEKLPIDWNGSDGRNLLWQSPLVGEGHASPIISGDSNHASATVANDRLILAGTRRLYCIGTK